MATIRNYCGADSLTEISSRGQDLLVLCHDNSPSSLALQQVQGQGISSLLRLSVLGMGICLLLGLRLLQQMATIALQCQGGVGPSSSVLPLSTKSLEHFSQKNLCYMCLLPTAWVHLIYNAELNRICRGPFKYTIIYRL